MRLCMFHPVGHPMERGWVGRIDGDRVLHLAAQTLQSFFTGGGTAREHAEYPLAETLLLAPVLHPPSIRIFDDQASFVFANPAAVKGPSAVVHGPTRSLTVFPRVAAVMGANGAIGGFTVLAEWRASGVTPPKDRDFAIGVGPVVVTPDEGRASFDGFDWAAAVQLAGLGTALHPGDILAGPAAAPIDGELGDVVTVEIEGIGALEQRLA
ncbi:MAG TPA: hypothetical protein VFT94_04795 [Gaiellaceae bacterium]|nr:hypothetical protein [Gaiellaceae bacterium]